MEGRGGMNGYEMRWLERPLCSCHEDRNAACSDCGKTERVLQYRYRGEVYMTMYADRKPQPTGHYEWTQWFDVPVVPT